MRSIFKKFFHFLKRLAHIVHCTIGQTKVIDEQASVPDITNKEVFYGKGTQHGGISRTNSNKSRNAERTGDKTSSSRSRNSIKRGSCSSRSVLERDSSGSDREYQSIEIAIAEIEGEWE